MIAACGLMADVSSLDGCFTPFQHSHNGYAMMTLPGILVLGLDVSLRTAQKSLALPLKLKSLALVMKAKSLDLDLA